MIDNKLMQQAAAIKLFILDVDGVLSDGRIIVSNDGNESKNFDVKDGLGIMILQNFGVHVAAITGNSSEIVLKRLTSLGISNNNIFQGKRNKIDSYKKLLLKYKLNRENVAYMGDDLPDIPLMVESGVSFAPSDAAEPVKPYANYIALKKGGRGAVREVCDMILKSRGTWDKIIKDYIEFGEVLFDAS